MFLLWILPLIAATGNDYFLLKDVRDNITIPVSTAQSRQKTSSAMINMLKLWVNREIKIQRYGTKIDPLPKAIDLNARAGNMTDYEFHHEYAKIFLSLRDLNTRYDLPAPHACYTAILPDILSLIDSNDHIKNPAIIVDKDVDQLDAIIKDLMNDALKSVRMGDEFKMVDGLLFLDYVNQTQDLNGGANVYAQHRRALSYMTQRSGRLYEMPSKNTSTWTMLAKDTNTLYNITMPWIVVKDKKCQNDINWDYSRYSTIESDPYLGISQTIDILPTGPSISSKILHSFGGFKYGVWKVDGKMMGMIHLPTFESMYYKTARQLVPSNGQIANSLRTILNGPLSKVDYLLLDIRNNGGGKASLVLNLASLFVPKMKTLDVRSLKNKFNDKIARHYFDKNWSRSVLDVDPFAKYSLLSKFSIPYSYTTPFQYTWTKPLALLHNSKCYGGCEVFAAMLQDTVNVTIFGEDGTTGGGGGQAVGYAFVHRHYPEAFPMITGQTKVTWQQFVRVGFYKGQLIEDIGVVTDYVVRPSANDLVTNTYSQFDKIIKIMSDIHNKKVF